MKKSLTAFFAGILPAFILILSVQTSHAGSATWKTNPASGDWNTATNWSPSTVPNGPSDTATFATSNTTGVFLSASFAEVNSIVFNPGASAFTIAGAIVYDGVGITNNSGITQNFSGAFSFTNGATAGSQTNFTIISGAEFAENSSAGNGTFTVNGGAVSGARGPFVIFRGPSTAGDATFTINGGMVSGANGGSVEFFKSSCHTCTPPTAGDATFIVNGGAVSGANGGRLSFSNRSTAGNATLIANGSGFADGGGTIGFGGHSKGGTPRVEVFGNGTLTIAVDVHSRISGVTIGSIEGTGVVLLGSAFQNHELLTVGSNNLSTVFSGVIQDSGIGGALAKIGTGTLTLAGANTYTGGTTINEGALLVNNTSGSGTGSTLVQVNAGILGGTGTMDGPVMVGSGTGSGAVLSPGNTMNVTSVGTLTTQKKLTFNSDATYNFELDSNAVAADKVVAHRVTINNGAQFLFSDVGASTIPPGVVFTVINNVTPGKIIGTFSNLPDGSTFTNNGNTYKVNYQGGDGNNLTLRVVP